MGDGGDCAPPHPPAVNTKPTLPTSPPPVVDVKNWKSPCLPSTAAAVKPIQALDHQPATTGWNTSQLGLRVGADAVAAGAAAVLVAPIITMIDRAIIENASGRNSLGASLRGSLSQLVLRPHRFTFSKPFALIYGLYFGTYLTANTIDTLHSTLSSTPLSSTTAGPSKFLATSSANLALCLYKDKRFTQMFGSAAAKPVPLPTFALFTIRDCLTVFASFNLPPLLAPYLESRVLSEQVKGWVSAASAAQIVTPAVVQVVSTPLHLLGLDLYNREGVRWSERWGRVKRDWGLSCLARMGRIVPAFGVGGVVNAKVRRGLMGRLEE